MSDDFASLFAYNRWADRQHNAEKAKQLAVLVASGFIVGEGIFGVVVLAKYTAAHPPDHRPMPPHKGCKSRLVTAANVVR